MKNRKDAAGLKLVEPQVRTAMSWLNWDEVGNMKLAKCLDFEPLRDKQIYAKFVRKEDKSFWEMHIDAYGVKSIVYVENFVLSTVT